MKKTGTYEWAGTTVNIQRGCEHNCRYCYARANAVRFGRCTIDQWDKMILDENKVEKRYGKYKKQPVMFPSTHDITPFNIDECIIVLKKLLKSGNELLIVTKPHFECVLRMCEELSSWKNQITFRFTIGTFNDEILRFWEPNAPKFNQRICSLLYANKEGYRTSVSMEPFLSTSISEVIINAELFTSIVTENVWIGKLRKFNQRVNLDGAKENQIKNYVEPLKRACEDNEILRLIEALKSNPKIRWKDSIKEVIERY